VFKFTVGSCFYPPETESNEFILLLVSCSMICQVVLYILSDPAVENKRRIEDQAILAVVGISSSVGEL
jgi:hypothetical protein